MSTDDKKWAAEKFGISPEEVIWYNSGSCYDRVIVSTKAAAQKVARAVKGGTANGGWYHGLPLGVITERGGRFDVTC